MDGGILKKILDYSEVWAPLIPLAVVIIKKPAEKWEKFLVWYLCIALFLNICVDILDKPVFVKYNILTTNHIFYNLNSANRLLFFACFFQCLYKFFRRLNLFMLPLFLLLAVLNFIFIDNIWYFSSKLMALEAAIILVYCISWYYIKMREEKGGLLFSEPMSWAVIGISLYSSVNFFIFLFYTTLIAAAKNFSMNIWNVHNILFVIMCVLFAIGFSRK